MCLFVCDRLKQTKISGFLQQHAIPYYYDYYYYCYLYVQPSSFDHCYAYEYLHTHTPMRVNKIHVYERKKNPLMKARLEYKYGPYMHVNVPWQCWHSDTVPSMQLCISILTSVLSLPYACVFVSIYSFITRMYAFNTIRQFRIDIYTLHMYTYITVSLVLSNHLCIHRYTYRRTSTFTHTHTHTHSGAHIHTLEHELHKWIDQQ